MEKAHGPKLTRNSEIHINPQPSRAYNNRERAYTEKGNYEKAMADYTQTIRIAPAMVMAYYNRGNL